MSKKTIETRKNGVRTKTVIQSDRNGNKEIRTYKKKDSWLSDYGNPVSVKKINRR